MSLKNGKRRLRRLPLFLAVTGAFSASAICGTTLAVEASIQTLSESQCDSDSTECGEVNWASKASSLAGGTPGGRASILSTAWGSGNGISLKANSADAVASLDGDISLGNSSAAAGVVNNYAISLGYNALSSGGNLAIGGSSRANVAGITNGVALGAHVSADRSNAVAIGIAGQTRKIQNLASGIAGTDAVNVSQLASAVDALGATFNTSTGAVTAPTFTVQGSSITTLNTAVNALDSAITGSNTSFSSLTNDVADGKLGLVQQNAPGASITVGAGTNGMMVDFTGTVGTRTLTGITVGDISSASTDAVNGSQLFATNQLVGTNTGDITTINNRISDISNGVAGMVLQGAGTQAISVASTTGGNLVDVTGIAGVRTVTGVAEGGLSTDSTDAVSGSQLYATQQQIGSLNTRITTVIGDIVDIQSNLAGLTPGLGIGLTYDDAGKNKATLGGANGTLLTNMAPGLVSAGSMQAINGGQLFDFNAFFEGQIGDLDNRATDLESQYAEIEKPIADSTLNPGNFDSNAGGERITDIAPGIADSDAVNMGQMSQIVENAIAEAQSYTDGQAAAFNNSLDNYKQEVDNRFKRQDERLDRIGAMSAASTHMAINASGANTPRGRVAVGAGMQNGKGAVAVGYARPVGKKAQLSVGGSFSGSESSAGVGLSISL